MKRRSEPDKRTLREDAALIWRAVKIWNGIQPHFWFISICPLLFDSVAPYFNLYMSASIINELAGGCDVHRLIVLVAITVGGGFALSVISRLLNSKENVATSNMAKKQEEFLLRVQNDFQYKHIEDPDVILLRSRLFAAGNAFGGGMMRVYWSFPWIAERIINIVFSTALTVSMFTMTAACSFSGFLGFINSPASALVIAALIIANAALSLRITGERITKENEALSDLASLNTRLSVYDRLWGADMVVFGLNRIVTDEMRKHNLRPKWIEKQNRVSIKYGASGSG